MSKDLRQFLKLAKDAGPRFYLEAKKPLKPAYQVGIIQQKLAKAGRFPVVYCPRITGSRLPLVTNLFASYDLAGLALDITPQRLATAGKGCILKEYLARRNHPRANSEVPATEALVRQVIYQGDSIDLGRLPITKHAELDADRYVTTGITIARDPDTGILNAGIYRQQWKGKHKLACRMLPASHGIRIARRYAELGRPMEVVTIIGHHPAVAIGATTGGSIKTDELEVMGALLGEPLEVTPGLTVDLPVPAGAEIAIEGIIDPQKIYTEGPFGEYSGYYGAEDNCYIIQVTALTMRRDAIYHDLYSAHQEHPMVGQLFREAYVWDKVGSITHNLVGLHYGPEGQCGKTLLYMAIRKRSSGDARRVGLLALGTEPATKIAIVVDDDIDVYDQSEVLWAVATRVRGDRDIHVLPGVLSHDGMPGTYDETGLNPGRLDAKILIDATRPLQFPFPERVSLPRKLWDSMQLDDYLGL